MGLVSLNLKASEKQLRDFGDIALCMCNFIGLMMIWLKGLSMKAFIGFCITGMVIYLLSRISTRLVRPVYMAMTVVTFPIGWLVSHVVMALFYYVIISGVGLVFKLLKRDPLHRSCNPKADSYWLPYQHKSSTKDYFHQF